MERERDADAGQRHVGQRVGGERHPAHHREAADEAGRDGGRDREQERFSRHARGSRAACRRPRAGARAS